MNNATNFQKTLCKLFAMVFFIGCLATSSFAQIFLFNNGAQVHVNPTAIVHVNGGFQNDNTLGTANVFENNGNMTIATISGIPGSVFLTNNSTLQGSGTYIVEQDWTNDATFTAGTSTVNFNGNIQEFITSTNATVTTFNNLTLTGTGTGINRKKTLQAVNARISLGGTFTINDRELETLTNTLYVLNPSPACVTNTTVPGSEGFVSSSFNTGGSGSLSRATNSASIYFYPTGSSVITTRYRPVKLTPASAAANIYTARLGNNNATNDGFNIAALDTNSCAINPFFYHEITRSLGNDNASIDIFYDQATDSIWDGLAQWNTPSAAIWNSVGTVTATSGIPFNDVLKANWNDFSSSPYILTQKKPDADFTYTSATYCQSGTNPTPTITGLPGGTFSSTPAGLSINPTTGTITLSSSALGAYTLSYTTPGTCSNSSSITMTIANTTPSATFTYSGAPFCQYGINSFPTFGSGASAGIFSTNSPGLVFVNVNTGQIDLPSSAPGTYIVINYIPISGSCMAVTATSTVTINPAPLVTATTSTQNICTGETTSIALTSSIAGTTFTWTINQVGVSGATSGTGSSISQTLTTIGTNQGIVTYTIIPNSNGCIGTPITVAITVSPLLMPISSFTSNPNTGAPPLTVNFTNSSTNAISYLWLFGTSDSSTQVNPSYVIESVGEFQTCLIAINAFGCADTSCSLSDVKNTVFIIPNIFSPNDDNVNDIFTIQAVGLKTMDAEIFNRWGQKIYEWHTTNGGWDGRTASGVPAPDGSYYYIINATSLEGKKYFEKGAFSLVR